MCVCMHACVYMCVLCCVVLCAPVWYVCVLCMHVLCCVCACASMRVPIRVCVLFDHNIPCYNYCVYVA